MTRALTTELVLELLQETAEEVIRPRWKALAAHEVSEKNPGDYVTIADHESEARITAVLQKAWPEALVVGEEATAREPDLVHQVPMAEHAFVVDPVDGTRNFIHGLPDYAVMVGELRQGRIVRGWIWQPEHDAAWVAELGGGVTLNGASYEAVISRPDLVRGATSHRRLLGDYPEGVDPNLSFTKYACGIDYPDLLLGRGEFLIYRNMKAWDHVPGTLMLRELGGVARDLDGVDYQAVPSRTPMIAAVSPEVWELGRRCLSNA